MFELRQCKCKDCKKTALSSFNKDGELLTSFEEERTEKKFYCLEHHPEKEQIVNQIKLYVHNHDKIIGLNASGIKLNEADLSNKRFYGCDFSNCTFANLHSNGLRMRMCNMAFCTISDCDFIASNIQFSNFTGSKLVHAVLTGSDLIHNNFNGITAYQTSFDDSDLYNSRFIKAVLITTSMNNCNLKKTIFYEAIKDNVSFKLSNTREALMNRYESSYIGDIRNSADKAVEDLKL